MGCSWEEIVVLLVRKDVRIGALEQELAGVKAALAAADAELAELRKAAVPG